MFSKLQSPRTIIARYIPNRQFAMCESKGAFQKIATLDDIKRFIIDCMVTVGATYHNADIFADSVVEADYRGVFSNGTIMLGTSITDIKNKLIDPQAEPTITTESFSGAVVCGHNALGAVVGKYCMDIAIEKARETGIALVAANGSNNYGMAAWLSMQAMAKGFIGMNFTNSSPSMVPTNAIDVALGTNPLSMAAPGENCDSIVLDIATTASSIEVIQMYRRRQKKIPKGWAVNNRGKPEIDPEEVLQDPRLLPIGGKQNYKGFGLALLVEVLSGLLSASSYGPHIREWDNETRIANFGHGFIVINPEKFVPNFAGRLSDLLNHIRKMKTADPRKQVLIPGDKERIHMAKVDEKGGIIYMHSQREALDNIAIELGVKPINYKIVS